MLEKFLFLFSDCELIRKDNNLYIETDDGNKKPFPIKIIEAIYCIGRVKFDSYVLSFLGSKNILLHIFSYQGRYSGSIFPESPEQINKSGFVLLQQVRTFDDKKHRLFIAKEITRGHLLNAFENIKSVSIDYDMNEILKMLDRADSINSIMGVEGTFKKYYYEKWNEVIKNQKSFKFVMRSKRPPADRINSLISFVNTFIYTFVLNEIYKTELDPRIGFLHEPNYKHLSLHLDIAEIFKPMIGDRLIFKILNKNIITAKSFTTINKQIRIKSEDKQKIISYLMTDMEKIVEINGQKINLYKLIRREVNQIKKCVVEYSDYKAYLA